MLKAVLFDLDGTLLPMDQDEFTHGYFNLLCRKLAGYGYDPDQLVKAVWKGTGAMVKNDGSCNNEEAFWRSFSSIYGEDALRDIPLFNAFYANEFQQAKALCGCNPKAKEVVELSRALGLRENIGYCKPNPAYYAEILRRMALVGSECLMVGNDVGEDMVAETLGMKVFLLTDCLINKDDADITRWPHGGFDDLMKFLRREAEAC